VDGHRDGWRASLLPTSKDQPQAKSRQHDRMGPPPLGRFCRSGSETSQTKCPAPAELAPMLVSTTSGKPRWREPRTIHNRGLRRGVVGTKGSVVAGSWLGTIEALLGSFGPVSRGLQGRR
jgi:hypothetical protein